jgi:Fic family protein
MIYQTPAIDDRDLEQIKQIEKLETQLRYLMGESPTGWQNLLNRNTFARSLQESIRLEGHEVALDDAVAAAYLDEPIDASADAWFAITGYRTALTCVQQLASDPYFAFSNDWIRSLHFMMLQFELERNPGRWRAGGTFISGRDRGDVLYEGPDARLVPELMQEFVVSLQEAFTAEEVHPIILAAMAHLNVVMIHPFGDGNGRVARCLQSLVLARSGGLVSEAWSVEEFLGRNMKEYFRVLSSVGGRRWNPERDARPWVQFILKAHLQQAASLLEAAQEYARLWEVLEETARNVALPSRTAFALVDAAVGHPVRNSSYRAMAEISDQVASRDLALAVKMGLLDAEGDRRGRRYGASDELRRKASIALGQGAESTGASAVP